MDWTIILCLVFANVIASRGDDLRRRFSVGEFSRISSRDYFKFGDSKHISGMFSSEKISPGHTLLRAIKYPQVYRKKQRTHYRKSSDLPMCPDMKIASSIALGNLGKPVSIFGIVITYHQNLLRSYLEHRLSKVADKRRSTLTQHSEEVQESVLPPSEPARPGHNLLQPTKTMLKSAAKFPRTDGLSLVYGSQDNLGIVHGKTPSRVLYSDFRKDNLADLITNILKNPNSVQALRRSGTAKKRATNKKKTLTLKKKMKNNKKERNSKQLDTKRNKIYHRDFDSSNEIKNNKNNVASKAKQKSLKKNKKVENHNSSNDLKETKTRAFQSSGSFGSYNKKPNSKYNKNNKKLLKPQKKVNIHSKIVEKLNEQLDQKLKSSKLKKMVPLDEYKKTITKRPKKKPPLLIRQSDNHEASSMKRHTTGKSPKYIHRKDSSSSEDSSYSREDKKHKILKKKFSNGSKKKHIFRQRESDGSSEEENQKDEGNYKDSGEKKTKNNKGEESKDKKNTARLVYGSPDNYGIVWAKTPYRTMYTDFRRTTNLLGKILQTYHSYKRDKNLKKALVAIKVWPLEKTKMNQDNKKHDQVLDSVSNEILDDDSIDIDVKVTDYRKQRRKSKVKIKSAFRNRDENYDKKNSSECITKSEEEESDDSDYEKNPGNPYTLFKNKYKQNWPWHFELGDHINLNQFGPEFDNQGGPSGADLFFNRKWWYFNQDDYIPFR